jgi:hypothetical protein
MSEYFDSKRDMTFCCDDDFSIAIGVFSLSFVVDDEVVPAVSSAILYKNVDYYRT